MNRIGEDLQSSPFKIKVISIKSNETTMRMLFGKSIKVEKSSACELCKAL